MNEDGVTKFTDFIFDKVIFKLHVLHVSETFLLKKQLINCRSLILLSFCG